MKRLAFLLLLGGCDLYFGNGNPPPPVCQPIGGGAVAAEHLRDPNTGECAYYGGGGYCDPNCGPCPEKTPVMPQPAFPSCDGACENLDEASCVATAACHASYTWDGTQDTFDACWDIQPLPVLEGGDCSTLDLYACAQHDDCASVLGADASGGFSFASCIPDTTASVCANVDCGAGEHCYAECTPCDPGPNGTCNMQCTPTCVSDQLCDVVTCDPGTTCEEVCNPDGCTTQCVPAASCGAITDEKTCLSRTDCKAVYVGMDCTCDANGNCTCASETFSSCQ